MVVTIGVHLLLQPIESIVVVAVIVEHVPRRDGFGVDGLGLLRASHYGRRKLCSQVGVAVGVHAAAV